MDPFGSLDPFLISYRPNKWISESRAPGKTSVARCRNGHETEAIPVPKLKCCVHFLKRPLGLVSAWGSCLEVRTNAAVKKHADCRLSTCWSQTLPNLSCTSRHIKCWWICWTRVQDEQIASFLGRCSLAQCNHLCAPTCSNVTRVPGAISSHGDHALTDQCLVGLFSCKWSLSHVASGIPKQ